MKRILVLVLAVFAVFTLVSCEEEPVVEPLSNDREEIMDSMDYFFYVLYEQLDDGEVQNYCWSFFEDMVYYDYDEKQWLLDDEFKGTAEIKLDSATGKYTVTSPDCSIVFKADENCADEVAFYDIKDNESGTRYVYEYSYEETADTYVDRARFYVDFCGFEDLTGTAEYIRGYSEDATKETYSRTCNFNNVVFDDGDEHFSLSCKVSSEETDFYGSGAEDLYDVKVESYEYNGVKYDPDFVAFALYLTNF